MYMVSKKVLVVVVVVVVVEGVTGVRGVIKLCFLQLALCSE